MLRKARTRFFVSYAYLLTCRADIPLSYGLLDVKIDPQQLSSLEFIWDARREGGIFVKINAISTEFTARRHGGEKGVPFRVQVETYSLHGGDEPPRLLHCASCQVKVFKVHTTLSSVYLYQFSLNTASIHASSWHISNIEWRNFRTPSLPFHLPSEN